MTNPLERLSQPPFQGSVRLSGRLLFSPCVPNKDDWGRVRLSGSCQQSDFRMFLILFYQSMDREKIKTWTLCFPAKEHPNMEKVFFDWPIVLQYDVKAKYRLISRKSFGHEVFSPECKATRVCIRSTNQSFSTPVLTGLGMCF